VVRAVRAFVVTAAGEGAVQDVQPPTAGPGEVVVDVARVGVCGTDVEFFTGEMAYLHDGHAAYPMRLGHEWSGVVAAVGRGVQQSWLGRRVAGDTMLGCGHCDRCRTGRQHLCADRLEVGIRGGKAGALAEQLAVPASSLVSLPDVVDDTTGAMVEPGGNALRAVWGAEVAAGDRVLVLGPGTIGTLAAQFARAAGAEVHVLGDREPSLSFARSLGIDGVWTAADLPRLAFDAVIDASTAASLPALALELVEPGGRVVYIGISGTPSTIDTRTMLLKDVTAVGILSGSPALAGAVEAYAAGSVDPRPLVAGTVGLDAVGDVLAGGRPPGAGAGPKIHVDPRLTDTRIGS
jgi:2-desacetyl-2-hydroxyethyl bacteriochlorophyllide A dehydrogenase